MTLVRDTLSDLTAIVGEKNLYADEKVRKVFSADAYDFSPVLIEALGDKIADVVVAPGSVDELREVLAYAIRNEVPITMRGAGTGNYGQSVPISGGIQVLMRRLSSILEIDAEHRWARVEPGVILGALERKAREVGLELHCYPSTYATATCGGFVGGGFGGVGSIRSGTLYDGAVLDATLLTAEATPQEVELNGDEVFSVIHAYGVTGVLTELKLALVPAMTWEESVISFGSLEKLVHFGRALATAAHIDKRLVSLSETPIPSFFKPLSQDGGVKKGRAGALLELAEGHIQAAAELAEAYGGTLDWQRPAKDYHKSRFSLSDFSWNHTTLWAMKADENYTYLQAQFDNDPARALEQIHLVKETYGEEVLLHLEFIRIGGNLVLSSLPLVYYKDKARLYEIIHHFEAEGIQVADPHTWRLDLDPRWNGAQVVEAKERWNPTGLLNPGKLGDAETGEIAYQNARTM